MQHMYVCRHLASQAAEAGASTGAGQAVDTSGVGKAHMSVHMKYSQTNKQFSVKEAQLNLLGSKWHTSHMAPAAYVAAQLRPCNSSCTCALRFVPRMLRCLLLLRLA
jgi:hypothetical protein